MTVILLKLARRRCKVCQCSILGHRVWTRVSYSIMLCEWQYWWEFAFFVCVLIFTVIRGARSKSTQAKVAIMKLKLKAEGMDSIPQVS